VNEEEPKEQEQKLEEKEETAEPEEEVLEGTEQETEVVEAKPEEAVAEAEKEEIKPVREEKPAEEEIVEERIYTIPLGRAWIMPPRKRSPRAMRIIRAFLMKHMKVEVKKEEEEEEEELPRLIITNEVNQKVWERGVEKPPRKIRVKATKDKDGDVTVYLAEGD
jgi:large subunit ribosomal protein L31e